MFRLANSGRPRQFVIPQAVVEEKNCTTVVADNIRENIGGNLIGHGLEIGPLHRPMPLVKARNIDYVDRLTVAELRAHYPELEAMPLVAPTILDDAETLSKIEDASYDFLVVAHVIEHMRNPLGALLNWCRVLRVGGLIYLVVPDKRHTFDRPRVRTTLEHLLLDYFRPSVERDFDHFVDFAVHADRKSGSSAIHYAQQLADSGYSIHYHVFMPSDICNLLQWFSENIRPLKILQGPIAAKGTDEFHLLLQVL